MSEHPSTTPPEPGDRLDARIAAALDRTSGSIVVLLGADFRILWVSHDGSRRLGGPARLVGMSALDLVHPNDLHLASEAADHHVVFADRYGELDPASEFAPQPSTVRVRAADGSWIWAEIVLDNRLADPSVAAIVGHLRLGTDRPLLAHAVEMISDGEALPEILETLADVVGVQLGGSTAAVVWWDGTKSHVAPCNRARHHPAALPGIVPLELCKRVRRSEKTMVVDLADRSALERAADRTADELGARHLLVIPVEGTTPGDIVAALVVWSPSPVPPLLGRQLPLSLTTELISLAITDSWLKQRLRADAEADPLTGVYNRAGFRRALSAAVDEGAFPLGVVFVDLDDFKGVNDRHGHIAGDRVLVTVAARLTDLDPNCAVGRMGGDEFAILTRRAVPDEIASIAERAVRTGAQPIRIGNELELVVPITAGYAAATAPGHVATLLARADDALMSGKRSGKARAVGERWGLDDADREPA